MNQVAGVPEQTFREGMVLAIETYAGRKGGKFGVRLEENILVTKDGYERLSLWPIDELMECWLPYGTGEAGYRGRAKGTRQSEAVMADLFRLDGKVAVVVGGGGGIGKALALGLARQGADVALASRNLEKLQGVAEADAGRPRGQDAGQGLPDGQLRRGERPERRREIVADMGTVDILVNSQGLNIKEPFENQTVASWNTPVRQQREGRHALLPGVRQSDDREEEGQDHQHRLGGR